MRRFLIHAGLIAILLPVPRTAIVVAQEKSATVSLQTFPKQLALAGGEHQQVLAVISIDGDSVRNVRLIARPGLGVSAVVGKVPVIPEGFHGDVTWPVTITKANDGRGSSDITLEADYTSGNPPKERSGAAFATLTVTLKSRPKAEEVVVGTIEASFDKLAERRPQTIHLTLSNISDVPVTITGISASLPDFVTISGPGAAPSSPLPKGWSGLPVAAGSSTILPRQQFIGRYQLEIPPNAQVLSGKYLLLVRADVQYKRDGYKTLGTIVAKKEFQVGVLGEDEFVGITSVPFLVLPGFVFITTAAILLSRGWPRWQIALDYKKPEYYFLSIVSAFGFIFLYAAISPWVYKVVWHVQMGPRDTFSGYSLADIINVWLLAISAALFPWIFIFGLYSLIVRSIAFVQKKKIPKPGDTPEVLLHKLSLAGKTFDLPEVTVGGQNYWEIPLLSPDPAKEWVARRIEVRFVNRNDAIEAELDEAVGKTDAPEELRETLNKYKDRIVASWGQEIGPQLVDKKDVQPKQGGRDPFVHLNH
jgi:hypothetical protein